MSSRLLSPTDLDPGEQKPNLISTYHSGKDIAFSIDRMGNVRSFDPKYTVANGLGKPVGFVELRKGEAGFWLYRAVHLATGKSERLWRSEAPYYESPITIIDGQRLSILTSRETPDQRPNYFMRTPATGEVRQLTNFPHPYPQLAGIQKELIRYERSSDWKLNGVSVRLYAPLRATPARKRSLWASRFAVMNAP